MTTMASQITSHTVVYSTVYLDADQRKHQSSASLAFVRGIHRDRWIPRTKGQLRGKYFHLMTLSCPPTSLDQRLFIDGEAICMLCDMVMYIVVIVKLVWWLLVTWRLSNTAGYLNHLYDVGQWTHTRSAPMFRNFASCVSLEDSFRMWVNSLWFNDAMWWTNFHLLSIKASDISWRTILQDIPRSTITKISLKITYMKSETCHFATQKRELP